MRGILLKWELAGIPVIFFTGAAFHFIFELSGGWTWVGAIAPVNESVFEHLKMTFWPTLIYAAISYNFVRHSANNFITGKAAALLVMPLAIIALFYVYTELTGWENVFIDILIFLAAVAGGQIVSYKILKARPLPAWLTVLSILVIIALGALYIIFTFYPPQVDFFMDTTTGKYGIP